MADSPPPSPPAPSSLPRKLLLLFLLAIDVALGLIYLLHYGNPVGYLSQLIFASGVLGLVAGFGSRIVLRGRRLWLRLMAALAMLTIGLSLIGVFSGWKFGLGPLTLQPGSLDRKGLVQLVFGSLVAGLSLHAWRRPPSVTLQETGPAPARRLPSPQRQPIRKPGKTALRDGKAGVRAGGRTRLRSKAKAGGRTSKPRASTAGRKRRVRTAGVQFSSGEEHRCPYCLEPVLPDDPRGIVECKICHTLHHADCWSITGACQVPHLNA